MPPTPQASGSFPCTPLALICGRLITSTIPDLTTRGGWFLAGAALVTALLLLWLTRTRHVRLAWLLVFAAGLTSAPFFGTILGLTFVRSNENVQGTVFGIIFAGALLGGAIVPKAIGNLAKGSSVQKSMILLVPLCLILIALVIILGLLPFVKIQ